MSELSVISPPAAIQTERPLCVDLDGTLVKSDTFVDSLMVLARRQPLVFLQTPLWALKGKASFKARVASMVTLDAEHLPYNQPLLSYLHEEHARGRKLYLATGADRALASHIAGKLGIFEEVLASDGVVNLTGRNKLAQLKDRFGAAGFDYIGNAMPDLPLLEGAGDAMLANPNLRLRSALRSHRIQPSRTFLDRPSGIRTLAKAMRVHQWAKNVLIFLPMLLAHTFQLAPALISLAAFFCFCTIASATYIFNDVLDLEADRAHLSKRKRAFAAGNLSISSGLAVSCLLAAMSLAVAAWLPARFMAFLFLYLLTTLAYSLWLKRIVLVDVIVLSGLYTVRMVAGSEATHVQISPWLAAFSIFFFLSLAMVKRFSELKSLQERGAKPTQSRGYLLSDLEQVRSFGTASAYASIVIFTLYINGHDVVALYRHPSRMWLNTPLMILWMSRVWLLASRGDLHEDPVVFALTDKMSMLLGLGVALVAWSAL
jgi:4-hydroxybenzoate polyprenyltransferase